MRDWPKYALFNMKLECSVPEQAIVEARQAAQKAIEHDPSLSRRPSFDGQGPPFRVGLGSPQRPKSSGRASSILVTPTRYGGREYPPGPWDISPSPSACSSRP